MEILNSSYTIKTENYHKPTPVILKKVADILLSTILVIDPLILSLPNYEDMVWFAWGWNAFVVLFKFVTKLITEEKPVAFDDDVN